MPDDPYRLPRDVRPLSYRVVVEPDLDDASFHVRTSIDIEALTPTARIVLNAADLEIETVSVTDSDGTSVGAIAELDESTERLVLTVDRAIRGAATLTVAARGVLNDKLRGLYRSTFTDADGTRRVIATTQLQATDARRMFPCWDEPDRKATFQITVVMADGLVAVSNTPQSTHRTLEDGRVQVEFEPTMVMSTYLVALVVGPLEITPITTVGETEIRIVHVPGKGHMTEFAGEIAAGALAFFESYYESAHPGPKLDLVALPDFAMGAMENLGCVTFRENLLLVDPASATVDELRTCADVICHEIAHMWFGDLVTMSWWNGIWLNEAFATFMEILAVDAVRPQWQRWLQFGAERAMAFDVDATTASRPVEIEVRSPTDAAAMFDVLTYQKGGALLRMLEQYLGAERFRDGVRHYLRRHAYGNTETTDLWDAIEETSGEPVRQVMDSWIFQAGHPLISAGLDSGTLVLSQQRFLLDPAASDDRHWMVPLTVRQIGDTGVVEHRVLMTGDVTRLTLTDPTAAVIVNADGNGFYRTRLDPTLRDRLHGPRLVQLTALERYTLLDDLWASVVAGSDSVTDYLAVARAFADEPELTVWQSIVAALQSCNRFADEATRPGLARFVRGLCGPALARLGLEPRDGDSDLQRQLRGLLWRTVATVGADTTHVDLARRLIEQPGQDPTLVAAATAIIAGNGTIADHTRFVERFESSPTPQEQLRFLYALAEFPGTDCMDATLQLVSDNRVRTQSTPFVLARAMANPSQGPTVWHYVREQWPHLTATLPATTIIRMLEGLRSLSDPAVAVDVAAFFAERSLGSDEQRLAQILERQRLNVALHTRSRPALADQFS